MDDFIQETPEEKAARLFSEWEDLQLRMTCWVWKVCSDGRGIVQNFPMDITKPQLIQYVKDMKALQDPQPMTDFLAEMDVLLRETTFFISKHKGASNERRSHDPDSHHDRTDHTDG